MTSPRIHRPLALLLFLLGLTLHASTGPWITLFDGKTFNGWRAAENPASFRIEDGVIICEGPKGHLFYEGPELGEGFENFELALSFRARAGANSGVFFHTAWQDADWPKQGFEVQVNNSQKRHGDYLELKMTGSLYGVRNVYKPVAKDDAWSTLRVVVQHPRVQIEVNGIKTVDYIEPELFTLPDGKSVNRLGRGTFALQAHDPISRADYKDIRVRRLGPSEEIRAMPSVDPRASKLQALAAANFPLLDTHVHLNDGLTLEQVKSHMYTTGINSAIVVNGGMGFPITNDAAALAFVESMKGQPLFVGLQGEGREWVSMLSRETLGRFDFVFSDALTHVNAAGKRVRLWIPEEAAVGEDVERFMDHYTDQIVRVISDEPIDIYVNTTFLPEVLAGRYEELWTDARLKKIIDAAVAHGVAFEINARFKVPSERFIRMAKAAGAKFTLGSNNWKASEFGDWSFQLGMIEKTGLTWKDMYVPGHGPSRAQRK